MSISLNKDSNIDDIAALVKVALEDDGTLVIKVPPRGINSGNNKSGKQQEPDRLRPCEKVAKAIGYPEVWQHVAEYHVCSADHDADYRSSIFQAILEMEHKIPDEMHDLWKLLMKFDFMKIAYFLSEEDEEIGIEHVVELIENAADAYITAKRVGGFRVSFHEDGNLLSFWWNGECIAHSAE